MMMRQTETSDKRDKERNSAERFFQECSIRAMEGEGNERKFVLSFSSEEPYGRWWGTEILDHKTESVDLTRLNTIGCLLFNHDRDKVIGKVIKAWLENDRGCAEVEFDTDAESEVIFQKVSSGTLKGVSVGYTVDVWEDVEPNKMSTDSRFLGPCSIATRWVPYEISIVSIPADPTVGVGRSKEEQQQEPEKGVSSFYFYEKQLQINNNLLKTGGM